MRTARIILLVLTFVSDDPPAAKTTGQTARPKRVVIAVSTRFDGKGRIIRNTRIVIESSKIVRVDPRAAPVDYDLRGLTVMPGWIDAHVHLNFGFGRDGKNFSGSGDSQEAALIAASNAWVTLMAGFTTVRNMGPNTLLRDSISKGLLAGPRILTIIETLSGQGEKTGSTDESRAYVRKQKEAGADFIYKSVSRAASH